MLAHVETEPQCKKALDYEVSLSRVPTQESEKPHRSTSSEDPSDNLKIMNQSHSFEHL